MKTSNPKLLAEIDLLEDATGLEANQLHVVKRIEELEAKLAEYENWKNWTRPYDCDGKLINEHALYIPKLNLDLNNQTRGSDESGHTK